MCTTSCASSLTRHVNRGMLRNATHATNNDMGAMCAHTFVHDVVKPDNVVAPDNGLPWALGAP